MKKSFVLSSVFCLLALLIAGCKADLASRDYDCEYGSIVVNSSSSRAVDVNSVVSAKVVVSGSGIDAGSEPSATVKISGGKNTGTVYVEKIPAGKNRVISVYAYDENGLLDENEIILRAVADVKGGQTVNVDVNKETTALGNVFAYLAELDFNIGAVTDEEKTLVLAAIDSEKSCLEINAGAIAGDVKANGFSGLKDKSEYINGAGGVSAAKDITVHAKGYSYIWYWDDGASGKLAEMTADSEKGEGWYKYTFTGKEKINLIFRKKGGSDWTGKTENLSRTKGSWYYENGNWTGSAGEEDSVAPEVSWLYPASGAELSECVHLIVSAKDDKSGISTVEFYADDVLIGSTTGAFTYTFDSSVLSNGTHKLHAVAKDGANNSSKTSEISVTTKNAEKAPKAVVDSSKTCTETIQTTFDGSKSTGSIAEYVWDFGDGTNGTGATVNHTYSTKGSYTAKLTVKSAGGLTDSATITVTVKEKGSFQHRDFREETVYFMMTDRFADGDTSNNNIWGDEFLPSGKSAYDYDEDKCGVLTYYHGGDYKGIINNLDYLKDMGFTAIWITPSVKQGEGRFYCEDKERSDGIYQASGFHGYWGYDFDQIDPHLHSSGKNSDGWDDFKAFVDACHAKGIRVMQDIVINHGNQGIALPKTKWADKASTIIMGGKTWDYNNDSWYDKSIKNSGFFNHSGDYKLLGLLDFNERGESGKDAREYLINVYKKYIDAGVDAFRIDTMVYITNEWAGEFADAMYNYAKSIGNDYFYMVGEAWTGRNDAVARHAYDKTDSLHMLDMQLSSMDYMGQMEGVFMGGSSFANISGNIRSADKNFACMTPKEYTYSGMFVDNHDKARMDGKFNETQFKNNLNFIYLFSGVPIVYYGTEAYYSNLGITHPTTNQDDVTARWMLGQQGIDKVKSSKPAMYKHLKALNELHSVCKTMKFGEQTDVSMTTQHAAFSRKCSDGKTGYYLLNIRDSEDSLAFDVQSGSYILYTMSGDSYKSEKITASGSYTLKAPANGFAILEPAE